MPNPVTDVLGGAIDTGEAIAKAGGWIAQPKNWLRVVYVAGGGALILVGVAMLISQSAAAKTVVKTGARVLR